MANNNAIWQQAAHNPCQLSGHSHVIAVQQVEQEHTKSFFLFFLIPAPLTHTQNHTTVSPNTFENFNNNNNVHLSYALQCPEHSHDRY